MADTKEHAHELIERLVPSQVSAVVGLLEAMLDPVSRAIAMPLSTMNHSRRKRKRRSGQRENG